MKTIAVLSQKGGAGKTTLAVHLAAAAAKNRLTSLILDTDPQATASTWAGWRNGEAPEVIDCASHALLPRKLQQAAQLGADLAVIDTPPHADIMAREAARQAELILIPCRPRAFDLDAVRTTIDLAKASGKSAFVVFLAGPPRAPLVYAEASRIIEQFGIPVAPVMLPERAAFHYSVGAGKTAQEIEPDGKAALEVAAVLRWVCKQVDLSARKRAGTKKGVA
jgi:chromosome partitioning protein